MRILHGLAPRRRRVTLPVMTMLRSDHPARAKIRSAQLVTRRTSTCPRVPLSRARTGGVCPMSGPTSSNVRGPMWMVPGPARSHSRLATVTARPHTAKPAGCHDGLTSTSPHSMPTWTGNAPGFVGGRCDQRHPDPHRAERRVGRHRRRGFVPPVRPETEHRHEPVPQYLLYVTPVGVHQRHRFVHNRANRGVHHLGIHRLDQSAEAAQIGEKDCNLRTTLSGYVPGGIHAGPLLPSGSDTPEKRQRRRP